MKIYDPQIATPTLKAFVYGDPGSGKTTLLASAMDDPRTSPILLLTCGGNPESIRKRKSMPLILQLDGTKQLNPIYDWFKLGQPSTHPFSKELTAMGVDLEKWGQFKSVAIDSLTEFQRICLDEITGNITRKIGDDLKAPDRQMWGQALSQMTKVARLFYSLSDVSVFMTALEKRETDESTGITTTRPGLWGQSDGEVPSYSLLTLRQVRTSSLSATERAKHKDCKIVAYTDTVGRAFAKEQYGDLPEAFGNPSVPALMELIYGKLQAANGPV